MKALFRHIINLTLISGLILLASCIREQFDIDTSVQDEGDVYMTFQVSFNSNKPTTRAQGTTPSINSDADDREDYVDKLAVLVFETGTNGAKVAEEYTSASFFIMKLKAGTYDFYFITNYPDTDDALKAKTKSEIDLYLQATAQFSSFQGAKSPNPLFPMARVYRSQVVAEGGTYANPTPFKPNVGNEADKQLKPVSLFGKDYQGATEQNTINLIRANAKIELNISGEGKTDIAKIEYVNAAKNWTFAQLAETSLPSQVLLTTPLEFDFTKPATTDFTTKLYVPERLFATNEDKGWNRDAATNTDEPIGAVNYIQITMNGGKVYKIPVISNGPTPGSGTNYLTFARDNTLAQYNIIRNHHYLFDINVPADGKEIDLTLQVMPWTLVESQLDFVRPEYTIQVSRDGVESLQDIFTEVELKDDIITNLPTSVNITFSITAPVGTLWTASISNGLEFKMTGTTTSGIVDGTGTEYTFTITPREPFDKTPRYTVFYIVVDGKELFLGFKDNGTGTLIPDCRYVGDGPAARWKFKQTMGI
ncbi:MAG: fimbrial protein [Fermentimonas sp.]